MVSSDFKKLSPTERNCVIKEDEFYSGTFKAYNINNCKYECQVKKAQDLCQCIPWDFIDHESDKLECDVFGRTCFFNAMQNLSHLHINSCPHCKDDCEFTKYRTLVKDVNDDGFLEYENGNWFYAFERGDDWAEGERELKDLFLDRNHTLASKTFKDTFNSFISFQFT